MCRKDIIKFLSEKLDKTTFEIEIAFEELYTKYKNKCCKDLVEEGLEIYTTEEYNACRIFLEFLLTGEKDE